MLQVYCEIDAEDYVAFNTWWRRHTVSGRRHQRRFLYFGGLLFLLFAAIEAFSETRGIHNPAYYAWYMLVSVVLLGILYWLFLLWLLPALARGQAQYGPRRRMLAPTTYTITPEGMKVQNPEGTGRIAWEATHGVAATDQHLFVLVDEANAFILPRRCFEDEAAAAEFEDRMEELYASASAEQGGE